MWKLVFGNPTTIFVATQTEIARRSRARVYWRTKHRFLDKRWAAGGSKGLTFVTFNVYLLIKTPCSRYRNEIAR